MTRNAALRLLVLGLFASLQTIHASAFLDVNGVFTTITAPGAQPGTTTATGINNLGQIIGTFQDISGNTRGYLDTNGLFTTIDIPPSLGPPGSFLTALTGINDVGQIVGTFAIPAPNGDTSFLYANGAFEAGRGHFTGINNSGTITAFEGDGSTIGFVTDASDLTVFTLLWFPPGTPNFVIPSGINNLGQIVGTYPRFAGTPVLVTNGVLTPIPGANNPTGINDLGQIIGPFGLLDTNGIFHAIDVPGSLPGTTMPRGINNAGDIVGTFTPAPVPESASLLFVASGLAGMATLRRYRSRSARSASWKTN